MWKQFLKDYLGFTHKERKGTYILLVFILLSILLPFFYPYFIKKKEYDPSKFKNELAQLKLQDDSSLKKTYAAATADNDIMVYREPEEKNYNLKIKAEEFYFDPNTTSFDDWKRLGVGEKTIGTIQKYLSKGGHFYKPEDLSKIWGFRPDDAQRLIPYVRIKNSDKQFNSDKQYVKNESTVQNYTPYNNAGAEKKYTPKIVDINSSDTTDFIALPGIGSKLANRIVMFRDKLGGFNSVDQIKEIYGLPDSTFQKIKPQLVLSSGSVKKININIAQLDEMKAHPYIRYAIANAIIQYRNQHGNFSSVDQIKNIVLITDEIYNKIAPYLIANK